MCCACSMISARTVCCCSNHVSRICQALRDSAAWGPGCKLPVMALRPFPKKSRYHSQEFIGARLPALTKAILSHMSMAMLAATSGRQDTGVSSRTEVGRPVAQLSEFLGP